MLQTICSLLALKEPLDDPSRIELSKLIATRQRSNSGLLMLEGELALSAMSEGLIDAYFLLYNTSYPVLHSQLFRDNYANRASIPNTSTWQLIFYTVLAIGHWVLSSGEDHADSPYYLAARSRMSAGMLESGTLAGVQAFLLMVHDSYILCNLRKLMISGKLSAEERPAQHRIQHDWYRFPDGPRPWTSSRDFIQ
jgi:transcriptional regulatory protein GAL4